MTFPPNRISAFGPLSPAREVTLARELLGVQSERELDRFLPLIAAAAPMIANIAGPLLKNLAGGLFGGGGSKKRKRPRDEQEQFLGKIVKGLIGETETGNEYEYENESESENEYGYETEAYEQEEQFLGGILKGLLGGKREMESYEQEQFLGSIVGKLFGRRELETENYVQEQFLGGILKGIMGGELEGEVGAGGQRLLRRARRFVRFVNAAACHAAAELTNIQRAGHRPTPPELQRIVFAALVASARRFLPRVAAAAFPGMANAPAMPSPPPAGAGAAGAGAPTMLELMIAEATPMGAPSRQSRSNGYPLG